MNKNFVNDFNILYENDSTSNYLVLRTGIDKPIINYQAQMLLNNKINGLLSFNINYIGDDLNCFYNVTSKCTLHSFMSRKRYSRDEFLITILNIINNIYQLKNYLLYNDNILLDERFIYVEPESLDIYFVYLPFLECKNDIKAFFLNVIVKLAKFRDEESDNYIQKLLEVIKDDLFNLSNLKTVIENLLGEEIKKQTSNVRTIDAESFAEDKGFGHKKSNIEKSKIDKFVIPKGKIEKVKTDNVAVTKGNIRIPNSENSKKQEQKNCNQVEKTKDTGVIQGKVEEFQINKSKILSIAIFSIQVFLLLVFILTVKGDFVKMSDNPRGTVAILVLIFLSLDILLIRMINEKRKKTDETVKCKPLQFITNKMKSNIENKEDKLLEVKKDREEHIPTVDENYRGETVIIKKHSIEKPYLKEKDGEEIVEIDKKSLLIGRMENFVDYVINSNAVGKIHAEIFNEGEDFYVMDCNSRNGTFLNSSRITPNTKNKVSNNDILRFANKEFIFICPLKAIRSVV